MSSAVPKDDGEIYIEALWWCEAEKLEHYVKVLDAMENNRLHIRRSDDVEGGDKNSDKEGV